MKTYLVLVELTEADGSRWRPGDRIELEEGRASIHLALGNEFDKIKVIHFGATVISEK